VPQTRRDSKKIRRDEDQTTWLRGNLLAFVVPDWHE